MTSSADVSATYRYPWDILPACWPNTWPGTCEEPRFPRPFTDEMASLMSPAIAVLAHDKKKVARADRFVAHASQLHAHRLIGAAPAVTRSPAATTYATEMST